MNKLFKNFGGAPLVITAIVLSPLGIWAANVNQSDTKTNCVAQRVQRLGQQQVQHVPAALVELGLCANLGSAIREL